VVGGDDGLGGIFALSANPILPAHIHLNPIRGVLMGDPVATSLEGVFSYDNLRIDKQGPDYEIRFNSNVYNATSPLTNTQELFVSFSNEYELRPADAEKGDLIGWSVATDGQISVLGAPHTNLRVKEVQTVTTGIKNESQADAQQEVQLVRIEIPPKPEIQSFYSTADVYATVGGHFRLNYGNLGPTRWIPANADPEMIEVMVMRDIPRLGVITVTKTPYIYCACYNAFNWTITFHDLDVGTTYPIKIDYSELSGKGAKIVGPFTIQNSSIIGGEFTLKALGKESRGIPYDVGTDEMIEAIADLGINAVEVQISSQNIARSRTWTITFGALDGSYEMPLLDSNSSGITGGNITIWHSVAQRGVHGPVNPDSISGLSGGFKLEWRNQTTAFLPYNASAEDVMIALQDLPIFNYVTVSRKRSPDLIGYTWLITFDSVNIATSRGLKIDDYGPFESLIAHNYLIGTNTTITIGSRNKQDFTSYGPEIRGEYGLQAGAVYVFQNEMHELDSWEEMYTIIANDTDAFDQFGHSVDISGDMLYVGAIGAETKGVPEKQSIFCSADEGFFSLKFRGWKTGPIAANISREDLIEAIEGDLGTMTNLHTVHSITIDDWGDGGFCTHNRTAIITFEAPVDGDYILFGVDTHADLELLEVSTNNLKYMSSFGGPNRTGVIHIEEVQKGTIRPHGLGSDVDGFQTGSAYVFQAVTDCPDHKLYCNRKKWIQVAQFFPTNSSGQEMFGYSISGTETRVAVGAPSLNGASGSVYLYEYSWESTSWFLQCKLDGRTWLSGEGDSFGYSVALDVRTLIVGAPGYNGSYGAAYVFKRVETGNFQSSQELVIPSSYATMAGDKFGCSVALDGKLAVVGACGYDDYTIYTGYTASDKTALDTGAVFVFHRPDFKKDYRFFQKLTPSNVRRFDQFGWDVAVDKSTIVVGSVENMLDGLVPSVAIMHVMTSPNGNVIPIVGYFRLQWVSTNETGVWETRKTRPIKHDESALKFRLILEQDLKTGSLRVARSRKDGDGGYIWQITFMSAATSLISPLAAVDETSIPGSNVNVPNVTVTVINNTPQARRGKTHVFTRESYDQDSDFEEQAFLFPFKYQRVDRCGYAVDVADDYALVGCPNRDYYHPNKNSGSAFIHKLDFLNLKYSDYQPAVVEGEVFEFDVIKSERGTMTDDIMFYASTLDRNAGRKRQMLIGNLFGLVGYENLFPYAASYVDISGTAGTAMARSQFYGSTHNESRWVDGMYDYRGLSDYVEIDTPTAYLVEYTDLFGHITTTPDTILENPDETFTVLMHAPGYWPSIVGRLTSLTTIEDNFDGYADVNGTEIFQYDKVYSDSSTCEAGYAVSVDDAINIMVSGCPTSTASDQENAGLVMVYTQQFSHWVHYATLRSPTVVKDGHFGDAVAIDTTYGREVSTIAVGEPGTFSVHVYEALDNVTHYSSYFQSYFNHYTNITTNVSYEVPHIQIEWNYSTTLTADITMLPQYRFGAAKTISLNEDILAVGAPGIETIFVFIRHYSDINNTWIWSGSKALRSVDYDYDLLNGAIHLHVQEFGASVAVSGRTIAVGSPFADYDKMGSDKIEIDWKTDGQDSTGFSRGKVYVFDSAPSVQKITLYSQYQLQYGTFLLSLNYKGINETSTYIHHNSSAEDIVAILEKLDNIDRLTATYTEGRLSDLETNALTSESTNSDSCLCKDDDSESDYSYSVSNLKKNNATYYYAWTVTFQSDYTDPPLFVPYWRGIQESNFCENCTAFEPDSNNTAKVVVTRIQDYKTWTSSAALTAIDKHRGDRFGSSIALDGNLLVVGAVYSATITTTTWDFETGTLQGWTTTGKAFMHQPTYGDNTYYRRYTVFHDDEPIRRAVVGETMRSGLNGRYFIGTYDKRPGDKTNYKEADANYPEGTIQGDELQGTMLSEPFVIRGNKISFLIGGGCDINSEYVELLIDGITMSKTTGKCKEKMERIVLDVSLFRLRTAQVRIADLSSGPWGHINVDDFRFDWDVKGGFVNNTEKSTDKYAFGGLVETSRSGAVHVFERHSNVSNGLGEDLFDSCLDFQSCSWREVAKLTASDKRPSDRFGTSIAANEEAGIIAVGSPYSILTGFYKETPSVYPHQDENDVSDASGLHFPTGTEILYENFPFFSDQASGSRGVLTLREKNGVYPNRVVYEESGSVYVYTVKHQQINHTLGTSQSNYWSITEHCKIQPPDAYGNDHFGYSVHLDKLILTIGAPGHDGKKLDNGAIYLYNAEFSAVSFAEVICILILYFAINNHLL
jgi:hypothetical protein